MNKIERERQTIDIMIALYCRGVHKRKELCRECAALRDYAHRRLSLCRWGVDKPTCRKCSAHCYAPKMQQQVRRVMRYAGPRMLFTHPLAAIRHLIREW